MSDKKDEEVVVVLHMKKSLYESIVKQFETLKEKKIDSFPNMKTVEEFILFYLKWLSNENNHMKEIETKVQDILETLKEKGIDLLSEFDLNHKDLKRKKNFSDLDEEDDNNEQVVEKKEKPSVKKS